MTNNRDVVDAVGDIELTTNSKQLPRPPVTKATSLPIECGSPKANDTG